jgi:hypothetical protein
MPSFERAGLTQQLVDFLKLEDKGKAISYAELGRIVKAPIKANHGNLIYARKILERDHNAVWICVKKTGIRRLNDVEIAERLPKWWLRGAQSKLRRGSKQADVVDLKQLDITEQSKFAVCCIQQELAASSLSKATARRLEKTARGTSNDLPAFTAVEWAISLSRRDSQ